MVFDPDTLAWTCHVCNEERPDAKISVLSRDMTSGGVPYKQNVRYCNDRYECKWDAWKVKFMKKAVFVDGERP